MWPLVMEAKRARAEKERMDVIGDILWLGMVAKLRSRRSGLDEIGRIFGCSGVLWRRCELKKERRKMIGGSVRAQMVAKNKCAGAGLDDGDD